MVRKIFVKDCHYGEIPGFLIIYHSHFSTLKSKWPNSGDSERFKDIFFKAFMAY